MELKLPRGSRGSVDDAQAALAWIVEQVRPLVEDHAGEHGRLASTLRQMKDRVATVETENRQLREENAKGRAASAELSRELAALRRLVADLNDRFTNVAGLVSAQRHPGKQTENDNKHHDVAGRYESFIDQEMADVVLRLPSPSRQAYALSRMSRVLFDDGLATADQLCQALLEAQVDCQDAVLRKISQEAAALRNEADALGREQRWDFSVSGDHRFDPVRQERVAGSADGRDPDEIVQFVVTPGYVVGDGRIIVKQRVFTARARAIYGQPTSDVSGPP